MKKISITLTLAFAMILSACATPAQQSDQHGDNNQTLNEAGAPEDITIGLIVSHGGINDRSFNQASWEGMSAFANSNNLGYAYFTPAEFTDAGYLNAIELAINAGAQIVITPGFSFAHAVYQAQDIFPDTMFALFDELPSNPQTWEPRIENNTVAVTYAEEQAGFLAGYAVVMEGHRNLGFIGGMSMPPVVRFGHGFILGAEYAAQSLGLDPGEVNILYHYAMTFDPTPEVQTTAAAWFNSGIEVIFTAAGGAGSAVMAAAEAQGGFVVGVDSDQSEDSETVITSALKGVSYSVYAVLEGFVQGNFPGGQNITFGAETGGVSLPMETSRFQNFTNDQYLAIFNRIANGELDININIDQGVNGLDLYYVTITTI